MCVFKSLLFATSTRSHGKDQGHRTKGQRDRVLDFGIRYFFISQKKATIDCSLALPSPLKVLFLCRLYRYTKSREISSQSKREREQERGDQSVRVAFR